MKFAATLIMFLCFFAFPGAGFSVGITSATKISELNIDGVFENNPCVTENGLAICFGRISRTLSSSTWDPTSDVFVEATRATLSSPFSNITTITFANVLSNTSVEMDCWMSDDRLRLYFASDRDGTFDIFYTSRTATSGVFGTPVKLSVSSNDRLDRYPRLTNNECSIYFETHFGTAKKIYQASRSDLNSEFEEATNSSPYSSSIRMLDIMEDGLSLVSGEGWLYRLRTRSSVSDAFPSSGWQLSIPDEIVFQTYPTTYVDGGSVFANKTRIIYSKYYHESDANSNKLRSESL